MLPCRSFSAARRRIFLVACVFNSTGNIEQILPGGTLQDDLETHYAGDSGGFHCAHIPHRPGPARGGGRKPLPTPPQKTQKGTPCRTDPPTEATGYCRTQKRTNTGKTLTEPHRQP